MNLPAADTPLYSHPLHILENWLQTHDCERDDQERHRWYLDRQVWTATLYLEETVLRVDYSYPPDQSKTMSFPYSLSREDVEQAVFSFDPTQD